MGRHFLREPEPRLGSRIDRPFGLDAGQWKAVLVDHFLHRAAVGDLDIVQQYHVQPRQAAIADDLEVRQRLASLVLDGKAAVMPLPTGVKRAAICWEVSNPAYLHTLIGVSKHTDSSLWMNFS